MFVFNSYYDHLGLNVAMIENIQMGEYEQKGKGFKGLQNVDTVGYQILTYIVWISFIPYSHLLIGCHHFVSLFSHNWENDGLLIHENRSDRLFAFYMLSTFRNLLSPLLTNLLLQYSPLKECTACVSFLSSNHLRAQKGVYLFINSLFSGEGSPETDLCSNFT